MKNYKILFSQFLMLLKSFKKSQTSDSNLWRTWLWRDTFPVEKTCIKNIFQLQLYSVYAMIQQTVNDTIFLVFHSFFIQLPSNSYFSVLLSFLRLLYSWSFSVNWTIKLSSILLMYKILNWEVICFTKVWTFILHTWNILNQTPYFNSLMDKAQLHFLSSFSHFHSVFSLFSVFLVGELKNPYPREALEN